VTDELVPLCQCLDLAQAQMIRGSLAARGVPALVDGEHQRGVLGMLGTAIELRVMVPRSQLNLARELASELIPDLAVGDEVDEDEAVLSQPMSPSRRQLAEDLEADEEGEGQPDEDEDEDETPTPRRKSIGVALVLGVMCLSLGLVHVYAGEPRVGGILLVAAAFGFGAMLTGEPLGALILASVWVFDLGRGIILIRRYNAAIDAAAHRPA
jgi:hypothetical protein